MKTHFRKLAVGFSVVLVLTFTARYRQHQLERPAAREVRANELVRRDGRMYFDNETEPFSGFLTERYASGELKARSRLESGLLEGVTEGWFTNETLQVRENFHAGVSHGVRTKWYENGTKMSKATIENGKVVGVFRRWHENGELAEVIHLKNGEPEGDSWAFYPSGYARATVHYENGALVRRESWKDGERKITAASQ